jgi:hypothetical protein
MRRRLSLVLLAVLLGIAGVAPAFARISAADFIKKWDVDHDGTLDLNEIDKAADAGVQQSGYRSRWHLGPEGTQGPGNQG